MRRTVQAIALLLCVFAVTAKTIVDPEDTHGTTIASTQSSAGGDVKEMHVDSDMVAGEVASVSSGHRDRKHGKHRKDRYEHAQDYPKEEGFCAANPSFCDIDAICTDAPSSHEDAYYSSAGTCKCKSGFVGSGRPGDCTAIKTCSTDNPCVSAATCSGNDQVGFKCACPVNTEGNGFTPPSGTGCTACTPPAWSPGGGSACATLALHTQFLSGQDIISQSRSLRGLATNGQLLYAGFIQGSTSSDLLKLSATAPQPNYLIGNGPVPTTPNQYWSNFVLDRVGTGSTTATFTTLVQGPKGLALDDFGYVYSTNNNGRVTARDPNAANLPGLASTSGGLGGDLPGIPAALDFVVLKGVRYLYACVEGNPGIYKLQINYNPATNKPASFSALTPIPIGAVDGGCRGLSVEDDGSVYYSGVPQAGNDATNFRAGHFVAKIDPNGIELARTPLAGAWGVAHFKGKVYVAQYLSTTTTAGVPTYTGSAVAVLDATTLQFITRLTPPLALAREFNDLDSGYSGLVISPSGMLYVADQIWKRVQVTAGTPATYFTPSPVDPIYSPAQITTTNRWYWDRVLMLQL